MDDLTRAAIGDLCNRVEKIEDHENAMVKLCNNLADQVIALGDCVNRLAVIVEKQIERAL